MTQDVTVVVVNFNAGAYLGPCLTSAAADLAAASANGHIIVVDNASTDGSIERLPLASAQLTLLRNRENRGFGAAVNQAARVRSSPFLWLLNPDTVVTPGACAALLQTLQQHSECAIAAPQLLNADGSTQESARGEPTAWTGLFGRHGILARLFPGAFLARRNLRARELVESGVESAPVDWVMGASMMIRRDVFDRARGFDERFFLYWEDADFCRRVQALGYSTRYVPRAIVKHPGGASSTGARWLASRSFHKSAYLYYSTHVVPSRWHPARWFAWIALNIRACWRAATARS